MQFIYEILSFNRILTVSLLAWFVAQVLKTIINFVLLGRFQLERMWGDGGMPSAHSATVCAMVIAAARSEGISSAIFAVASVVAIITMHDAKRVGNYEATVHFHKEVEIKVPVTVVAENEAELKAEREAEEALRAESAKVEAPAEEAAEAPAETEAPAAPAEEEAPAEA